MGCLTAIRIAGAVSPFDVDPRCPLALDFRRTCHSVPERRARPPFPFGVRAVFRPAAGRRGKGRSSPCSAAYVLRVALVPLGAFPTSHLLPA